MAPAYRINGGNNEFFKQTGTKMRTVCSEKSD